MLVKPEHVEVFPRVPGVPAREARTVCPYQPPMPYVPSGSDPTPPPACYYVPAGNGCRFRVCPSQVPFNPLLVC